MYSDVFFKPTGYYDFNFFLELDSTLFVKRSPAQCRCESAPYCISCPSLVSSRVQLCPAEPLCSL